MSFWTKKKVLVTGAAGLLGSYVTEMLVKFDAEVTAVDDLSRGHIDNLQSCKDGIKFIKADLRIPEACRVIVQNIEIVLNIAAKVAGLGYNVDHDREMFVSNLQINTNMLEAAANAGVNRFLVVSSACIYPHDAPVPTPETFGGKGAPEKTNEGYGWAKYMAEVHAHFIDRTSPMGINIIRPYNFYGPRDYFDEATSHVIPALIKKIINGCDPVEIWGDGKQGRSFIHVCDVARLILILVEKYSMIDPVNIGTDEEISMEDLAMLVLRITNSKARIIFNPQKPSGYRHRAADTTKLRSIVGNTGKMISIEDGIKELVEYYIKTKNDV